MPTEETKLTNNMMEVDGPWAEECGDSEMGETSGGAETMLGSSTLTLAPLVLHSPPIRRSQPISISHRAKSADSSSSAPSIPNPFPELCSPSKSPVLINSLPPQSSDKHMIKVYGEDSHGRSVWVSPGATAREVCQMLVQTAHCTDQENWALLELHPTLGLERCLEDHEVVLEVQATWSLKGDTRLIFCKNYAKYEFFRKPMLFFPDCMISDSADVSKGMTSSDLIQNLLKSGTCPEIQGFLHSKDSSRKAWKRVYFFLRRSGLYCSTKGSSKEPRHLQCVADLQDLNVYTVVNSRKLYGAPSDFTFCIKPSRNPVRSQDLKILCAENEQIRTCWTSAFRLYKHGKQLQCNYQLSKSALQSLGETRFTACKSKSEASLVAMDFSGNSGGRVIQNPVEAESAEREEGRTWRRREALRCSQPNLNSGAKTSSIHKSQLWFHGRISRKDTQRLMEKQGLVDGMFLIRESQQHGRCFVLSLCHKLKTRHYLIIPKCDEDDRTYYTMDDGDTLFIDVMQLVEFHQINKGILPVCLKHPCVCVAL